MSSAKKLLYTPSIAISIFLLFSCQKSYDVQPDHLDIMEKVKSWLDTQKIKKGTNVSLSTNKVDNIDLLSHNLDFEDASSLFLDKESDLFVIPVMDQVKKKKNLISNSTLAIFLFTDKSGK